MNVKNLANYRVPTGIVAGALLLWGIGTEHIAVAVILAGIIEGRRLMKSHWDIDEPLLTRIWTLCTVLFLVSVVIGFIRQGAARAGFAAIQWVPVTMLPIVLAQLYGAKDGIPIRILSAVSRMQHRRKRASGAPAEPDTLVSLDYPYVCMVLIAAGTPTPKTYIFYFGAAVLVGVGLFMNRGRPRMNPILWLLTLLLVVAVGHVGHIGLHNLHVYLENSIAGINLSGQDRDADRAMTRIGAVGKLKQSKSIDWWLEVEQGRVPAYLKIASFDNYRHATWLAGDGRELIPARKTHAGDWVIVPETTAGADSEIRLLGRSQRDETQLAIPDQPVELITLEAEDVARRRTGLTVAYVTPRTLNFRVRYIANANGDLPPSDRDLEMPDALGTELKRILSGLKLDHAQPRDVVTGLSTFFRNNFQYSMYLDEPSGGNVPHLDPLIEFLEVSKKGHCEYFATTTALMLRAAGIPTRYVVGYAVSEYDRKRDRYVIRGMHAHAWVQAWLDNHWELVDTTPGAWLAIENEEISSWQSMTDWLESLPVAMGVWLDSPAGHVVVTCFRWGSLPLLALYLWFRLFRGQRSRRVRRDTGTIHTAPGMESAWYSLEPILIERLGKRDSGEPLALWWQRVQRHCEERLKAHIDEAITLHYRLRFDNSGCNQTEADQLKRIVRTCLDSFETHA